MLYENKRDIVVITNFAINVLKTFSNLLNCITINKQNKKVINYSCKDNII